MSNADTLYRHWQTLRLVPRHPASITAEAINAQLAMEGFEVSKRTVERDLHLLSHQFPLAVDSAEKPYRWYWSEGSACFDLPNLSMSEAFALLLAKKHLHALVPSPLWDRLSAHFRLAEQKINPDTAQTQTATPKAINPLAKWLDKVRILPPNQPLLPPAVAPKVEEAIHEGLLHEKQVRITYHTKEGERDVYPISPLGLVQRGALMYVVCTIKSYQDLRLLVLHRIESAEGLSQAINPPKGFSLDDYLASGALGFGQGKTINLELAFDAVSGAHLLESPLSADQQHCHLPDGRLQVSAKVVETPQLTWWLLGFGEKVEVLAPDHLRQEMIRQLEKARIAYLR